MAITIKTTGERIERSPSERSGGGDRGGYGGGGDRGDRGGYGGGRGRDRDGDDDDRGGRRGGGFHRKKVCRFCSDQDFILDYKDWRLMQSFVTEHGKIVPRRISGNCAFHQRTLTTSVKRARNLALVGYVTMGT